MHDSRDVVPPGDAALERAIEQALRVEPSPAFVARVRHRLSSENPLRVRRGWLVVGLSACAVPALVVAYLALPGRTVEPSATRDHVDTSAGAGDERAGGRVRGVERAGPGTPAIATGRVPRSSRAQPTVREIVRAEDARRRWTIAMPDIVISQAEVDAVSGLLAMRGLRREAELNATHEAVEQHVGRESPALDVAELSIPPLTIEPLELTARMGGESE